MADDILGTFKLDDEIARFPPEDDASGRRAETLIKAPDLRVVLVTMRAGAQLHEHLAPGAITIHALRGEIMVTVGDEEHALAAGGLISLSAGVRHAVLARSDGAFLLTIAMGGGHRALEGKAGE